MAARVLGSGIRFHAQEGGKAAVIANGHRVSIEYSLKLADGTVAGSNGGGEALAYEQGA